MWLSPIARCLAVSFSPSTPTADLLKTCTDLLSRPHNRVSGPALKLLMPSSQEVILEKMRRKKFWNITEVSWHLLRPGRSLRGEAKSLLARTPDSSQVIKQVGLTCRCDTCLSWPVRVLGPLI